LNFLKEFKVQNSSNLLILRQEACIESFLPIRWHTFMWWKIYLSAVQPVFCTSLKTPNRPPNIKRIVLEAFTFQKMADSHTQVYNPSAEEVIGFEVFLY